MNLFACLFVYNKGWPELKKSTKKIEKSAKTFLILFDNLRRENSLKLKSKMGAKPSYSKKLLKWVKEKKMTNMTIITYLLVKNPL